MQHNDPELRWPHFFLRRADQAVAVGLVFVCLAALMAHWCYHGGHQGQMLEVERLLPGTIPFLVDLNQADWPELTVLPGVGETLAKRIVASRENQGPFREIGDLTRVNGIGPRTLERLRPYLRPVADLETTAEAKVPTKTKS